MDNSVYELLIARQTTLITQVLKAAVIALLGVFGIIALFSSPIVLGVVVILGALVYFFVLPRFSVEFEYTLLYQELDIDVIYQKSKRKSLTSFDLREAEIIAPANSKRLAGYHTTNTVDYSARNPEVPAYAIVIPMNKNLTKVLIQPDEGMLNHIRNNVPRNFFTD